MHCLVVYAWQTACLGVCMKQYYYGAKRRGPYFEGWYFKFLTRGGDALALIPALHIDRGGKRSASLQVISRDASWWLEYADTEFLARKDRLQIQMGPSLYTEKGVSLHIEREGGISVWRYSLWPVSDSEIGYHGAVSLSPGDGVFPRRHQHGAFVGWTACSERSHYGFFRRYRVYRNRPGALLS